MEKYTKENLRKDENMVKAFILFYPGNMKDNLLRINIKEKENQNVNSLAMKEILKME